jgi:hypothetical protein
MAAKPRAPSGLGAAGKALWSRLTAGYVFEEWETTLVEMACRQADDLNLLDRQIRETGIVSVGSQGQERLAQVVTEARLARSALARLLGQIKLPTESAAGEKPMTERGRHAQKAAEARWSKHAKVERGKHSDGASA